MLQRYSTGRIIGFVLFDWLGTIAMLILAAYLRVEIGFLPRQLFTFLQELQIPVVNWWEGLRPEDIFSWPIVLVITFIWPSFFAIFSVYDGRRNQNLKSELVNVFAAIVASSLVLSGILFLTYRGTSRGVFVLFFFLDLTLLLGSRICWYIYQSYRSDTLPRGQRQVLIIGAGEVGQNIALKLITHNRKDINLVGFLDDGFEEPGQKILGFPVLGVLDQVIDVIKGYQICDAVVALPLRAHERLVGICKTLQNHSVRVHVVPDLFDITFPGANLENFGGFPIIDLGDPNILGHWQIVKRIFDIVIVVIGSVFIAPLLLIISILIKVSSPGPVFYLQPRVGLGGKKFYMVKFRTMYDNAEAALGEMLDNDPLLHLEWTEYQKLSNDPRITPIGKALRRLSLDELPQIWNVIVGDMSLIGPRPFLFSQVEEYGKQAYKNYIRIRPGMTGMWQVSGRNQTSFAARAQWDEYYIRNWSVGLDLKILLRTIGVVFQREGAY